MWVAPHTRLDLSEVLNTIQNREDVAAELRHPWDYSTSIP